jgi:hypothetical protein
MLVDSGFTVDCCGTGVHTVDLSLYDIIVVAVTSNWYSVYTQEEADSLVSFYNAGHQRAVLTGDCNFCDNSYMPNVDNNQFAYNIFEWLSQGGGILIMGENTGCPNANVRPVSQALSMDNGVGALSTITFSNFAAHPVFNNVSSIYYIAPGEISAVAPAAVIGWTDGTNIPTVAARDEAIGIELCTFNGQWRDRRVILRWDTSCELNNGAWRVDRKMEGDEWNTVVVIPSEGNSPKGTHYSYVDDRADRLSVQMYRLGTIDRFGALSWEAFLKMDPFMSGIADGGVTLRTAPNPFREATEIRVWAAFDGGGMMELTVYDMSGRAVRKCTVPQGSFPSVVVWDGTDDAGKRLQQGMYMMQLMSGQRCIGRERVLILR